MVGVELFAMHFVLGIKLNGLSVVNLATGLGLSVEFICHIIRVHSTMSGAKTAPRRIFQTLQYIGPRHSNQPNPTQSNQF